MNREEEILNDSLREFSQLQVPRNIFAAHWEEVAELVLPTSRNTFYYGNFNQQGEKKTERQVDASAALALDRFAAILDSLLTPRNQTWHMLGAPADHDYLMKDRATKLWYEQVNRLLFKHRYSPIANFSAQNNNHFVSLGAFGNGSMFVDSYQGVDGAKGLRYKNLPLGEMFFRENHQGLIDGFCRWFRLTAMQATKQFEIDSLPESIKVAAQNNSQQLFEFLHRVCPRDDYDPDRYDGRGKLFRSVYLCLGPQALLTLKGKESWDGGYNTFPAPTSRYIQTPGEVYGRGPMMQVLPAIKTLNAEKRDFLTQGHRAATPVLLTRDDGQVGLSMRPGAMNPGFWSEEGKPLVGTLPAGDIQITKEMMDEEKAIINSAALSDLFQVLLNVDPKVYTATQVMDMAQQRGVLIAPALGRQQSEYLGQLIPRELDVLAEQRLLPPMPPLLKEAGGEYEIQYTSPLARDMRAQEAAGIMRSVGWTLEIVNATQDPSALDIYDFDVIGPEVADINGVPATWMASDEKIKAKRDARAKQQEQQQQIQAAPAAAALTKANAVAAKAGQPQ